MEPGKKVEVIRTVKNAFAIAVESFIPALSAGGVVLAGILGLFAISAFVGSASLVVVTVTLFYLALIPAFCAVTLVAQARAMGIEVPVAPGALFAKLQFWKYIGAYLVCVAIPFGVMAAALAPAFLLWAAASGAHGAESSPAIAIAVAAGLLAGAVVATVIALRLCLVMPALAAGHPFSLRASWNLMRGNALGFLGTLILATLPASLLQSLVETVVKSSESTAMAVAGGIAVLVIAFVQCLVVGAAGGIYYRELAGKA